MKNYNFYLLKVNEITMKTLNLSQLFIFCISEKPNLVTIKIFQNFIP